MGRIRPDMPFSDFAGASKNFAKLSKWLFLHDNKNMGQTLIDKYGRERAVQTCEALNSWEDEAISGASVSFNLYSREEIAADPSKGRAHMFFMPGEPGAPWVLVCPGGAYAYVSLLGEGFPVALELNRMGFNAFILQYRVGKPGLLPDPLEDVAAAIKRIRALHLKYRVARDDYAVMGFSAGGHLAAQWGTAENGCAKYGLPKPGALILGYPAASTAIYYEMIKAVELPKEKLMGVWKFLETICGAGCTWETVEKHSTERHISAGYPPTYMIHCEDDFVVPIDTCHRMASALSLAGVDHGFERVATGGHGFGSGAGMDADGWLERACDFWRRQVEKT